MNENKPNAYTQNRKLISDWTDKKNNLIHYRMLNHKLLNNSSYGKTTQNV